MARDHFVYRIFDQQDRLLYIGCSKQPEVRWRSHKAAKAWAGKAVRFHKVGPLEMATAYDMERAAIAAEQPAFNRMGLPSIASRRARGVA